MDLHFLDARPSDEERAAVDAVLGPPSSGWQGGERSAPDAHVAFGGREAARASRPQLLPVLHAVNDRVGWVSQGALNYVAQRLEVPPAEAYGVLTFYALLSPVARPPRVLHVCTDLACRMRGATELTAGLGAEGAPQQGGRAAWHRSPCLGLCERAPAAMVVEAGVEPRAEVVAPATADDVEALLRGERAAIEPAAEVSVPQHGEDGLVLLRRIGRADPSSLADYRANGGYTALRRALEIGPAGVIREVTDAKLLGRGGAAFPTGRKWDAVAGQPAHPHHLVCNADESEPGTFKDRVLMEGDPFAVVEAMTIAGLTTGCEHGYLYLRGEYPRARQRLEHAIAEARRLGFLGEDVMGSGRRFDISVFRGAGAYICGEETAIFNSIEGYRGEPRNKPPFPVEVGLFGQPTLVNNVETLVNVLPILLQGGPAYAATGTEGSSGTRLFCVSGRVVRPGVYEVPFGVTLAELLDMAGGVPDGGSLRAVLLGGAAGGFVGPDALDLPLTFEGAREAGATLGSGVVMVLDETVDLVPFLLRVAAFFRDESCGQCVPCRVGTVRQEEALHRLAANGHDPAGDLALLADVGRVMRDASICGLGQTASSAIESAIARLGVFS
ncbi:MAG TPA: NAD(P)H-dependent oxidoreductase subunit E [Acidimicrobiales bacterium]